MKLSYVSVCGFRGYRKPLRVEFSKSFTILDGRNGVGKSTVFDAIEFALTGALTKYSDATSGGETIADYIWWNGQGEAPSDHYVEVGFEDDAGVHALRRTRLENPSKDDVDALTARLCDRATMPKSPLQQLCASSIIRDEQIAALSLDLSEGERYARLRDAMGATDAGDWLERGNKLHGFAKRRVQAATEEVETAGKEVTAAVKRLDEIRASLQDEAVVSAAVERLQAFVGSTAPVDRLVAPVRERLAASAGELQGLVELARAWEQIAALRASRSSLDDAVEEAASIVARAEAEVAQHSPRSSPTVGAGSLERRAAALVSLISAGRAIGRQDGCCPLCGAAHSEEGFEAGVEGASFAARRLSSDAAALAEQEQRSAQAEETLSAARRKLVEQQRVRDEAARVIAEFDQRVASAGIAGDASVAVVRERHAALKQSVEAAEADLRIIETLRLNTALARATSARATAEAAYSEAERRLGLARRAERQAQALHDAARRSAGETLDRRLEQALPLIAELYQRLRPHPVWGTIGYKLRGDVKRFLRFQVGNELNPQFIFSSGQRRATGLAFLLSVNLSLAWSRWRTILLDDPVQHVDDFRSIHLAEVMAQLTASGRQIICAVEDAALADLLCRRLPAWDGAQGRRVTLGPDQDGAMAKLRDDVLVPLPHLALLTPATKVAS